MEVTFGQMGDLGQSGCSTLISRFHKTTQDKHWLDSHQKLHMMSSPQWEAETPKHSSNSHIRKCGELAPKTSHVILTLNGASSQDVIAVN